MGVVEVREDLVGPVAVDVAPEDDEVVYFLLRDAFDDPVALGFVPIPGVHLE